MGFAPTFYFGLEKMSGDSLEGRIRVFAESAAKDQGLELIHSEIVGGGKNRTVRIFIDKGSGITHDDCAGVSTRVAAAMDRENIFPSAYILEVSSPGLERGLYSLEDFHKFSGRPAKIKTHRAINGQKHYRGRIIGIEGEEIIFDDKSRGNVRLPYESVAKANLEIDFEEELKRIRN